jgi:hypothetical protein
VEKVVVYIQSVPHGFGFCDLVFSVVLLASLPTSWFSLFIVWFYMSNLHFLVVATNQKHHFLANELNRLSFSSSSSSSSRFTLQLFSDVGTYCVDEL